MKSIHRAFKRMREKGWPKVYICIDLHEVILTPTYTRHNVGAAFYPGAIDVLQKWTQKANVCLILWTSSHQDAIDGVVERFAAHGIKFDYFSENPEVPSGPMCDFSRKFYFDIVMDDKGFFDAESDWYKVKDALIELGEW